MNHHQTEAVQQRDHRKQQRVGIRREPPHREMRAGEQRQIGDGVLHEIPTQALLLIGLDEQKRQCGDDDGEAEQEQLGVAPVGKRGSDGHG